MRILATSTSWANSILVQMCLSTIGSVSLRSYRNVGFRSGVITLSAQIAPLSLGTLIMATLSEFKVRLGKLTATKGLDPEVLEVFIEDALTAFSEYNPERVLLKKVPVDPESNGFYDVPADADSVVKVFVHNTDTEVEFDTELDSVTNVKKIRLGPIERPSTLLISGDYDPARHYDGISRHGIHGQDGYGGYDAFDIEYLRPPAIERLTTKDLRTVQLYVEYLGYLEEASKTENLVDITDQDSAGDSTTVRRSNIGRQWKSLADSKMVEFNKRVIRPYSPRRRTYNFQYYYGQVI